jgi:hypothetical protein
VGVRNLAEAVILQSLEDLCSEKDIRESIGFFRKDGFKLYAGIAQMSMAERIKLLKLVDGILKQRRIKKLQVPKAA